MKAFPWRKQKDWRVLRVALAFLPIKSSFIKVLSTLPLRTIRAWKKMAEGLVPAFSAGAMDGQKPPGGAGHPEKAEYKYPTQDCTNVQFC